MIIVSGKASDMYKADACKMQASAFFRCRKITDANVLNGFFKRLETYPEMKTERFTAVKRSVLRSFPTDFTGNTIYYLNSTDFCGIL